MPSQTSKSSAGRAHASALPAESFPAPVYAETVLARNFADSQKYFLDALLDLHAAHALMLARQKILPRSEALRCLEALDSLNRAALKTAHYDGSVEDFFFEVERRLSEACSEDIAGKLHTARSRNDRKRSWPSGDFASTGMTIALSHQSRDGVLSLTRQE